MRYVEIVVRARRPGLTLAVDESEITGRKRAGLKAIDRLSVGLVGGNNRSVHAR